MADRLAFWLLGLVSFFDQVSNMVTLRDSSPPPLFGGMAPRMWSRRAAKASWFMELYLELDWRWDGWPTGWEILLGRLA